MRHEVFNFLKAHALLDGPLHTHQTDAILIFQKFTYSPDSTIAEMIDIIDRTTAVFEVDQVANDFQDIVTRTLLESITHKVFENHAVAAQDLNRPTIFIKAPLIDDFRKLNGGHTQRQ